MKRQVDVRCPPRKKAEKEVLLVDCLTLWINNLMYEAQQEGRQVHEDEVEARCGELLDVSAERSRLFL